MPDYLFIKPMSLPLQSPKTGRESRDELIKEVVADFAVVERSFGEVVEKLGFRDIVRVRVSLPVVRTLIVDIDVEDHDAVARRISQESGIPVTVDREIGLP
jgi:hypothetical protein